MISRDSHPHTSEMRTYTLPLQAASIPLTDLMARAKNFSRIKGMTLFTVRVTTSDDVLTLEVTGR